MTERKPWTESEDKALKELKQDLNIKKWSEIAKLMDSDYNLPGRNGKQCRQRYHNHLDTSIILKDFGFEQEELLFKIHSQIGNKWSIIARQFSGRTDNFLKNHFHSKLRKAIRRLNKQIKEKLRKNAKSYKLTIIYKIVEASDYKFCSNLSLSANQVIFFQKLKNQLLYYAGGKTTESYFQGMTDLQLVQYLMEQLQIFQKNYIKRNAKNSKKNMVFESKQRCFRKKNRCHSTTDSQCESFQLDESFQCFKNLKFETELKQKSMIQSSKQETNTDEIQIDSQMDDKVQPLLRRELNNQMQVQLINEKNFYSFVIQNSEVIVQSNENKKNEIQNLIQQDDIPFLSMDKKMTFSECGSMRMIDESYQVEDSQIWIRRLQSYSNIDQALFE